MEKNDKDGPEAKLTASRPSPIPGLEWHITDVCNYRCEYCCERQFDPSRPHLGMMSDELVERVLEMTSGLEGTWRTKFGHGEPTLHPRFTEVAGRLCEQGHLVGFVTNFSMNKEKQVDLVERCGENLEYIHASLHVSQTDIESFLDRVLHFQSIKKPATEIAVNTVMIPEKFEQLAKLYEDFTARGITMNFQVLKAEDGFQKYPNEIEEFIKDKVIKSTLLIRDVKSYGMYCHTGELFFIIKPNGDCLRCFNQRPLWNYLGSLKDGSFSRYDGPRPCLSPYCKCLLPAGLNMLDPDRHFSRKERAAHMVRASAKGWRFELKNRLQRK